MKKAISFLAALLFHGSGAASAQSATTEATAVQRIAGAAEQTARAGAFSGVLLVGRGDSVLYHEAFGRDGDAPMQRDTRFGIASITKTFVTVAIAKLVDQGRLDWSDTVGTFLPNALTPEARALRIRHLLTHTSGLREFEALPEHPRSLDDFLAVVARAQRAGPAFEAGTRVAYTNANFVILAKIIEVQTGVPFHAFVRDVVLDPAGMRNTAFVPQGTASVTDYPAPFCCAVSTARDLLRFAAALQEGRLVAPGIVQQLFAPKPEPGNWGFGFDVIDDTLGIVGHGGSFRGQSHALDMFTRTGHTVVVLSNVTNGRSPLRERVREILTSTVAAMPADTQGFLNINPSWSPDGRQLVFESSRHGNVEIYVIDADGTNERRLTWSMATVENTHPSWSPDGRTIVFDSNREGFWNLYTIQADGLNERRLLTATTPSQNYARHPEWSPDGRLIAFDSDRDGNGEFYVVQVDGSSLRRITDSAAGNSHPLWTRTGEITGSGNFSPDGKRMVFLSQSSGTPRQYVVRLDTADAPRALNLPGSVSWEAAWSRDGSHIAFYSNQTGKHQIYIADADGNNVLQVTGRR